jgi:hypothetical protein
MLINYDLAWWLGREHHRELLRQAEEERTVRMAKANSSGQGRSGRELIAFLRRTQKAVRRPGILAASRSRSCLRNNRYGCGRR